MITVDEYKLCFRCCSVWPNYSAGSKVDAAEGAQVMKEREIRANSSASDNVRMLIVCISSRTSTITITLALDAFSVPTKNARAVVIAVNL